MGRRGRSENVMDLARIFQFRKVQWSRSRFEPQPMNKIGLQHKKLSSRWQTARRSCTPCCAVRSCPLVNDCDLLAWFFDFYFPVFHSTPPIKEIPSSYRIHIWYKKTRMAGLQSGEGRMMIDSIVLAQYVNVTDTQPHRRPHSRFGSSWQHNIGVYKRRAVCQR